MFDAAERSCGVLLFDEADALFGKRSEIKEAHDRYANIEASYLLQRMEAYDGVAIFGTNFPQNLDQAWPSGSRTGASWAGSDTSGNA